MFDAIYVMWIRQVKKYLRSKTRMISSLGQPLLFLIAFGFGFGPMFEKAGGGNYVEFLAPGIIAMSVLFTAMFTGIEVIWDRQFGFLKETLVAPVSRIGIFLGRTLGGGTIALMQGLIVMFLAWIIGVKMPSIGMLLLAIAFMFMIGILFTAFGTAIATLLNDMHAFPIVINFVIMPLFFLSGALFPLSSTSKVIDFIARINPLSYGVDGLRAAMSGVSHLGFALDFVVLFVCIVLMAVVGGYMFSRIEA